MAFRDDREALEAKLRATETRLADAETERDRARVDAEASRREAVAARREALEARIASGLSPPADRRPRSPHGPILAVLFTLSAMAALGGLLADARHVPHVPPERLVGEVEAVSGAAPVTVGAPCAIGLVAVTGAYDCRFHVVCGTERLYGGANLGYVDCDVQRGRFISAYDGNGTAEEGDPMLFFDRSAATLDVIEPGAWNVSIRLRDARP